MTLQKKDLQHMRASVQSDIATMRRDLRWIKILCCLVVAILIGVFML